MNALDPETLADSYLRNESCTLRNVWRYKLVISTRKSKDRQYL